MARASGRVVFGVWPPSAVGGGDTRGARSGRCGGARRGPTDLSRRRVVPLVLARRWTEMLCMCGVGAAPVCGARCAVWRVVCVVRCSVGRDANPTARERARTSETESRLDRPCRPASRSLRVRVACRYTKNKHSTHHRTQAHDNIPPRAELLSRLSLSRDARLQALHPTAIRRAPSRARGRALACTASAARCRCTLHTRHVTRHGVRVTISL